MNRVWIIESSRDLNSALSIITYWKFVVRIAQMHLDTFQLMVYDNHYFVSKEMELILGLGPNLQVQCQTHHLSQSVEMVLMPSV